MREQRQSARNYARKSCGSTLYICDKLCLILCNILKIKCMLANNIDYLKYLFKKYHVKYYQSATS
jgi:hypothetical protein